MHHERPIEAQAAKAEQVAQEAAILTRFERATLSHCDDRKSKYLLRIKSRDEMNPGNPKEQKCNRLKRFRRRLGEEKASFFFLFGEQFVGVLGGADRWPIRATMISIRGHRTSPGEFGVAGRAQPELFLGFL